MRIHANYCYTKRRVRVFLGVRRGMWAEVYCTANFLFACFSVTCRQFGVPDSCERRRDNVPPISSVSLLLRRSPVPFQYPVYHPHVRLQLGPTRRTLPPIPGRHRVLEHLSPCPGAARTPAPLPGRSYPPPCSPRRTLAYISTLYILYTFHRVPLNTMEGGGWSGFQPPFLND